MNFDGNFRRVGSANVNRVCAYVEKLTDESWQQDSQHVQVIYLVHDDQLRHDQLTRHPALEILGKAIRPVLAIIADHYDMSTDGKRLTASHGVGYFVRARLLRLSSDTRMRSSADTAFSETHSHRVHVPLITSGDVATLIADESLCIPVGELYELNNRQTCEVVNSGDDVSVHLIVEYVLKGEMCCCGKRQHPDEPCSPEACYEFDHDPDRCLCFR